MMDIIIYEYSNPANTKPLVLRREHRHTIPYDFMSEVDKKYIKRLLVDIFGTDYNRMRVVEHSGMEMIVFFGSASRIYSIQYAEPISSRWTFCPEHMSDKSRSNDMITWQAENSNTFMTSRREADTLLKAVRAARLFLRYELYGEGKIYFYYGSDALPFRVDERSIFTSFRWVTRYM